MKRKLSLLLVLALMLTVLAACGQGDSTTAAGDTTTAGTTTGGTTAGTTTGATTTAGGGDDDTSVSADLDYMVWHPNIPDTVALQVDHFNEIYPNVNVNIIMMTGSGTYENLQPRIAANDIPDILSVDPVQWIWELADDGLLGDLSSTQAWNNMYQSCRDSFTSPKNGVAYGIPYGICSSMIFYNKDAFLDAGVDDLPQNYDEFLALCQQLKDAGYTPMVWYGGFTNMISHSALSWGLANDVIGSDMSVFQAIKEGTYDYTSDGIARVFEKQLEIVNGGFVNEGYLSTDNQPGMRLFLDGDAAMIWYGTWSAATFFDDEDCEFEIDTMVPPWNDAGSELTAVLSPETGWGIANNANYDVSLKFLDFIAFEDYVTNQNAEKNIPIYPESVMPGTIVDPRTTKFIDAINPLVQVPLEYQYLPSPVSSIIRSSAQEILIGTDIATVQQNLNNAQAEWLAEQ